MKVAYATVQNKSKAVILEEQFKALNINRAFIDYSKAQSAFQLMYNMVEFGDEIIIMTLEHLGKNYPEIRERVLLLHSKKVKLTILDAEFLNFDTENQEFNDLGFQLFIHILEDIPRMKKAWIKDQQLYGIEQAKKKGLYKGRKLKYAEDVTNSQDRSIYFQIEDLLLKGFPISSIHEVTGVNRTTIYRIKKKLED